LGGLAISQGLVIDYGSIQPTDSDGDGYSIQDGDCNDGNPTIFPGAFDIPLNGVDENCDGHDSTDPADLDLDGDGFSENRGDCNDSNPNVNPTASDVPNNGVDENCNGIDTYTLALGLRPGRAVVGSPTDVLFFASIQPRPALSPGSIAVFEVDWPTPIAVLHDDGRNGDSFADDGVYGGSHLFMEPTAVRHRFIARATLPQGVLQSSESSLPFRGPLTSMDVTEASDVVDDGLQFFQLQSAQLGDTPEGATHVGQQTTVPTPHRVRRNWAGQSDCVVRNKERFGRRGCPQSSRNEGYGA
jgi:hypothetical protein